MKKETSICTAKCCSLMYECKRHLKGGAAKNAEVIRYRDFSDDPNFELNDRCTYFIPRGKR